MKAIASILSKQKLHILIIITLTFLAYSNIFQNEFVGDDEFFIIKWDIPKDFRNLPRMFTYESVPKGHEGVYRPFKAVFLTIAHYLQGENLWLYHLDSVLIHLVNTIVIYLIIRLISKKLLPKKRQSLFSFIVALLFGLHPIHTEAITQITASFDTLGISFFLGSFYFYLKSKQKFPKYSLAYFLSLILAEIAIFYYEITIVLPLIIVFYDYCFEGNLFRISPSKVIIKRYSPFFAGSIFYIFVRFFLLQIGSRGEYLNGSLYITMLTMTKAFVIYLTVLIFPLNLTINHTIMPGVQVWINPFTNMQALRSQSIFDLDILRNLGIIIGLLLISVKCLKRYPLISFSIGWIFIAFLPVSFVIPLNVILQERYAYLASFGFVLLLSTIFYYLLNLKFHKSFAKIIRPGLILLITVIIFGYFYRTYLRNKDWHDSITMGLRLVEQLPKDVVVNHSLASYYQLKGDDDLAIKYYKKSLEIEPNVLDAYYQIGIIYQGQGKKDEAIASFAQALKLSPDFLPARAAMNRLSGNSKDAQLGLIDDWAQYYSPQIALLFYYPKSWNLKEFADGATVTDPASGFTIEIRKDVKKFSSSIEDYILMQKETYGNLINQGPAKIPNIDYAYLKQWDDKGIKKYQFFIFKKNIVIKAFVFPADSSLMSLFDEITNLIVFLD